MYIKLSKQDRIDKSSKMNPIEIFIGDFFPTYIYHPSLKKSIVKMSEMSKKEKHHSSKESPSGV